MTMSYSETVKDIHQLEYLKSVEGRAPLCHIHRYNVIINNYRLTVLVALSDPTNRE
jgi:hypothetical protein